MNMIVRNKTIRAKSLVIISLIGSSVLIAGCGVLLTKIDMPVEGYDAIQFTEFTVARDHGINDYAFTSGRILINDRELNGVPLFCGLFTINGGAVEGCLLFENNVVVIGYGSFLKEVRRDLTGKIRHIRVNVTENKPNTVFSTQ